MLLWIQETEKEAENVRKNIFCVLLAFCMIIALPGCRKEQPVSSTVSVVETTKAPETTAVPTEVTAAQEQTLPEVIVGFLPTQTGAWQYAVIEDREAAVAAAEKATNAIYSDEWWIKGDRTNGLQVEYQGEIWTFVESGELVYALGRVKAEDAADLLALCEEAARAAGWKEAVKPEQLKGIVSATLRCKGNEYLLTDGDSLKKLEAMLTTSQYVLGGTGCPFTALLDVETESGETLTVALATDSCGAWLSEGYYYEFGSDSKPLYDLFGLNLEELW